MKFYAGMALAAILLSNQATAQHSSQKVTIGIKAGVNIYDIPNNFGANYQSMAGFNAGLLGHIHVVRHVAIEPEVVYSAQGARYNFSTNKGKLNLDYINVPVLVQYMFDNGFRLQAGPQAGFLISAKTSINGVKTDVKNNFKTTDVGIAAGLGYVHPASGLGIDARYNFELTNVNKNSSLKSKNSGAQIGLFYLFHHRN